MSHFLHGKEWGILGSDHRIQDFVKEARAQGILFDVGHGRHHMDFNVAKIAVEEGFLPDTISTDLTRGGMVKTVKDFPHTLSKFLNLGMTLSDVIACATTNPARILGMADQIGALRKDAVADIAVFALEKGDFQFQDTEGNRLQGTIRLTPRYTVQQGQCVWQAAN